MSLTGWLFFLKNPDSIREDFLVYGCTNTSSNKLPFALATTSIQTRSYLQSCHPANKEAQYFFVYGCSNASLNKFPFARATTPIKRHVHLHSYPQAKNVPPRLQKQNCTNCVLHSARTVHAQCTVQCMPQCTATKRCKYHGIGVLLTIYKNYRNIFFLCFLMIFGKKRGIYSVLWPCTVTCTVTCTVQNTMFVPPYIFISRTLQFCFWRRAGTFYISAPCKAHSSDLQFLPTCGANAAMLLLCLWVAATCKREFVQACVCTSINEKILCFFVCW